MGVCVWGECARDMPCTRARTYTHTRTYTYSRGRLGQGTQQPSSRGDGGYHAGGARAEAAAW